MRITVAALATLSIAVPGAAQTTNDPFPSPIETVDGLVTVNYTEFAEIPDVNGQAARIMLLLDEPGTGRLFLNDMRGPIYSVSYDGLTVTPYVDINAPQWGVRVEASGRERGFQSFAFHPQFGEFGAPGYGKFYTWTDSEDTAPTADFTPGDGQDSHDTVLLEWSARNAGSTRYDGAPPRELLRVEQPFGNHNGGHIAFSPLASPGDPDFGMLYVGVADGGSGGDPFDHSQDLSSIFGKIIRIHPLGSNSANGRYGIPLDNPFAQDGDPGTLGEVYASGIRNAQRFGWDPVNGNMFVADIGQNIVEELSLVTGGADLGWNDWEGSFRFISRSEVALADQRGDPNLTYPVAEYGQTDPLFQNQSAITGVHVYRSDAIPQLSDLVLFGDFPSGEVLYVDADDLPEGGQASIRRVLFRDGGQAKTLLRLIQEKNVEQGKEPAGRADLRFGAGPDGQVFILNKHDGTVRLLVP
jgi:glucose/arabinose dehydrogenase